MPGISDRDTEIRSTVLNLNRRTSRDRRPKNGRRRTIAQALAEDRPAWFRIHVLYSREGDPVYTLYAWTAQHTWCDLPDGVTAQLLMDAHPEIDWWRSHDVDAVTGAVYAVPEPDEDGALPEVDGTFGDRRPPHLVADRKWADRGWFDTAAQLPIGRAA